MSESLPTNIAIFGPGLLGGSLALALRKHQPKAHLRIWARRDSAAEEVKQRGLADIASTDVRTVCDGADFIILCTPVASMLEQAKEILSASLATDCVITDVGSVKGTVVNALDPVFANARAAFIGSHPMAGSEKAGLDAARVDLFDGKTCILTPTLFTRDVALAKIRRFWKSIGCRLLEMSPDEHDHNVARISHMPHLTAAAVAIAALKNDPGALECVGNGFRNTTRIAAGDPGLWSGIVWENREEIITAVRAARDGMSELLAMLEKVDEKGLRRFLDEAKKLRDLVPDKV